MYVCVYDCVCVCVCVCMHITVESLILKVVGEIQLDNSLPRKVLRVIIWIITIYVRPLIIQKENIYICEKERIKTSYIYIYIYVCVCICIYMYMYVYVYVCMYQSLTKPFHAPSYLDTIFRSNLELYYKCLKLAMNEKKIK